ncbi:Holliday junction branch migration protein RuvA [Candidatus Peregrinibacteria bacterium]|nr:Holliday junction branch migration protein RuvA [Candidatus Peregrinibacteria bacterium]MBI5732693.1 Holliday junction branch migration protein RuvA [Candidatus Jorgensenbacteria bacterium]
MIYTLHGELVECGENLLVVRIGGIGFKVTTNNRTLTKLPSLGSEIDLYTFLYVREERIELFGFLEEEALRLFELLNAVAGVGPRTSLSVLDVDSVPNIMAAIIEKRSDLLTHASGIGRKTAERIILDLESKIKNSRSKTAVQAININQEAEDVLTGLGYSRHEVRQALEQVGEAKTVEDKLKLALKELGRPRHA